jgi:hypothetical protein
MADINFVKRPTPITINSKIYQFKAVRVTEKAILETGRLFKLAGDIKRYELTKRPNILSYIEDNAEIRACTLSGAIRHIDRSLWQIDDGKTDFVIDDKEAVDLAKKYIKQTNLVPLAECSLLRVTRLRAGTLEKATGNYEERVIDVGVVFQRMVDGIPVEGPGGKVAVYIDHDKKVTGSYRLWRELGAVVRTVPSQKLVPPKFAEDHLIKYWKDVPLKKLEVTDARFGYFELGEGMIQKYLQPAYIMPVTMVSPDGHFTMHSVHVVPAAVEAAGEIMPPLKVISVQPARS